MKISLFKSVALGVMLSLGLGATAQEELEAQVKVNNYLDSDYSIVSVVNPTKKGADLQIKDTNGTVVFTQHIHKGAYSQEIIDLTQLNDGKYSAVLYTKGKEAAAEEFALINSKVTDAEIMTEEELRAFFRLNDNILYISHIALGTNSFGISIEDAIGEEVFKEGFEGNSPYSGKFDVSELPNGNYSVKISSGDNQYRYVFNK